MDSVRLLTRTRRRKDDGLHAERVERTEGFAVAEAVSTRLSALARAHGQRSIPPLVRGGDINTRSYWDDVHATEIAPGSSERRDYALLHEAILGLTPQGSRVVDVGCGRGILAAKLIGHGCDVVGLDFSEPALKHCQEKGIYARYCELPEVPQDLGIVDIALCSEVLEHLDSPRDTVVAIAAIVRRGGLLIVSVPSVGIDFTLEHVQLFSRRDVVSLINGVATVQGCVQVSRSAENTERISWLVWGQIGK